MSWFDPLRNYCERTADTFWAEPINATTNLAFIIAAYMLLRVYKQQKLQDRSLLTLIALVAIIGAGSFLFHTFANGLTLLAD